MTDGMWSYDPETMAVTDEGGRVICELDFHIDMRNNPEEEVARAHRIGEEMVADHRAAAVLRSLLKRVHDIEMRISGSYGAEAISWITNDVRNAIKRGMRGKDINGKP